MRLLAAAIGFAAVASLVTPGPAHGQKAPATNWTIFSQDPLHTDYVDLANINRAPDGTARIWVVQDFHRILDGKLTPMGQPGREFMSVKYEVEIQCGDGVRVLERALFYAAYSGHMGAGFIVDGGPRADSWAEKPRREVENFACH